MKKVNIKSQSKNYTISIGLKNLDPLTKFLQLNNFKKAEYHWKFVIKNFESSEISKKAIEKLRSLNIENN